MSADENLRLHWEEGDPGEEVITAIDAWWDSLTEEGEAAKIALRLDKDAAVAEATEAIPGLDWDDMLPAERKIAMNRPLSEDDRAAILTKYPQ